MPNIQPLTVAECDQLQREFDERYECQGDHDICRALETIRQLRAACECKDEMLSMARTEKAEAFADVRRIDAWLASDKPADVAFTAGPERQIAYRLEVLRRQLDMFRDLHRHAVACVDQVFQVCTEIPEPILPDFCQLGDDKFEAVIRLAREYKKLKTRREAS